ncbi:Leucine carboxyl methyltransferase 2 [Talaromyces islandicus]|uniref:tRNA wybutosine-synthesizing protein 4 n=1 Tax=Talaromyces islandicus TaxID=28573 RepID=A0A0U1LLY6_TALIS|nr:Leucine carboxyl methyltransferase 2 [Talaromyces islandicus]
MALEEEPAMAPKVTKAVAPKVKVPTKLEREADLVMGTNNSSIVSKRSVELRYYPRSEYFRPFVKKPQRRAPLINRGYWLRMHAIAQSVRQFLQKPDDRPKFVLNLGCGYDPLAFQFLDCEKQICGNATFVDIDYEKLMGIKTTVIQQTDSLQKILGETKTYPEPNAVLLRAPQYVAVGCDLKNLKKLESSLEELVGPAPASVLCIAEVSLTYMDIESADALLSWLPKLGKDTEFCLLEQFFPDGPNHPFAYTMMNHFHKLQAPLHSIHKYPSLRMQEERFTSKGWLSASARSLWEVWNDNSFLNSTQRMDLDTVEPFDEWEEFALFASHYFLLTASTSVRESRENTETAQCNSLSKAPLALFSYTPQIQRHRRFAAVVSDSSDSLGVHGGLGNQSRMVSTDVYVAGKEISKPVRNLPPNGIPALRIQTEDRTEHVLVYGGKSSEGFTLGEWLLWNTQLGWEKPEIQCQTDVPSRFGASMVGITSSTGFLFGGMSQDGIVLSDFWKWTIKVREDGIKVIELIDQTAELQRSTAAFDYIGRFGASVTIISDNMVIIGGLGICGVLPHEMEILCLNIAELVREECDSLTVQSIYARTETPGARPLLVGHVSCNAGISSTGFIVSGGAVCFSFGTFWNNSIWLLQDVSSVRRFVQWELLDEPEDTSTRKPKPAAEAMTKELASPSEVTTVPSQTVETPSQFEEIMARAQPVVITGAELGRCTSSWTKEYLIQALGADRQVIVHEAHSGHMNFQKKNFSYVTKGLKVFLDEIYQGSRQYLRSISADHPMKKAANLAEDFAEIQADFQLPPSLQFVREHSHSSPLRISGPVTMWLHYDVMANVYCQIQGQKKLILYPPSDVQHLQLPPGASSSVLDVFDAASDDKVVSIPNTSLHEAVLNPGDILFIPPLWLHAASPTKGVSIAVNVFFRSLSSGYAMGRDVYANRDLHAYEKGRSDLDKVTRSFDGVPPDMANFYLLRLADELREKAQK